MTKAVPSLNVVSGEVRGDTRVDAPQPPRRPASTAPSPSAGELAVAARGRSLVDELVDALYSAVAEAVPAYGAERSPVDRGDMRNGIAFTSALFLTTVLEGRAPDDTERRALQRIGAQRFRQGVSIGDLTMVCHVAQRAGYRYLLSLVRRVDVAPADSLEVAGALADRLAGFMQLVAAELTEGYAAAQAEPVVDGRARAVLVDRVLERRWSDPAEVVEHGHRVGVDLVQPWGLILVMPLSPAGWSPRRTALAVGRILGDVVVGQTRTAPVPHLPILARPPCDGDWERSLERLHHVAEEHSVVVAHAEPCDRLDARSAAWQQPDPLLRFAAVAAPGAGVVALRDLAHLSLLSAAPIDERFAFVREVLGGLLHDPRLLETLQATYESEDSSVEQVASLLHCHKNTVYQRWGRIERLTGLDLAVPRQRHQLFNALVTWRVVHEELDQIDRLDA